jgi:hypothetical protein
LIEWYIFILFGSGIIKFMNWFFPGKKFFLFSTLSFELVLDDLSEDPEDILGIKCLVLIIYLLRYPSTFIQFQNGNIESCLLISNLRIKIRRFSILTKFESFWPRIKIKRNINSENSIKNIHRVQGKGKLLEY